MPLYDKPVRLLMKDMVTDLGVINGQIFTKQQVLAWFEQHYPLVKSGTIFAHLTRLSINAPSRKHYKATPEDDLFFQVDSTHFRLYIPATDPLPLYEIASVVISGEEAEEVLQEGSEAANEFAYEKDLKNFLSKNLSLIELGLSLYDDGDNITGLEFPVGGRYIDILANDRNGGYVVIELKVSRAYDRVVGQLLRYIAWIKKNLAESSQSVRGIIIAREISEDLSLACSTVPNIELFEYNLKVSLNKISV